VGYENTVLATSRIAEILGESSCTVKRKRDGERNMQEDGSADLKLAS